MRHRAAQSFKTGPPKNHSLIQGKDMQQRYKRLASQGYRGKEVSVRGEDSVGMMRRQGSEQRHDCRAHAAAV